MTKALAATVVAVASLTACVSHPVGPARSYSSYEAKARTTAESARSSVATARLIAETANDGKTLGGFASISISESEDALVDTIGTFGSIQPPDRRSQELRAELDGILRAALDDVTAARIDIRRGQFSTLENVAMALHDDETALDDWLSAHGKPS